jgi:DNA-binding winged helix-turn-helix (wHTH) protein
MTDSEVTATFAFEQFVLDTRDRRLRAGGEPVELNGRYLDALALLVRAQGQLVSKDQFMAEVWRGVPVTDEALTQCIRTLRRQLGDDASRPRFIETVPKHGYRFIAPVAAAGVAPNGRVPAKANPSRDIWIVGGAGTIGGVIAGFIGGLLYGFLGASQPLQPGMGAASVLLVLLSLTILVALLGGVGVSFGMVLAGAAQRFDARSVAGAALGGLVIGGFTKLLELDAFSLLIGHSPGNITGAFEGLMIGLGVGFGALLAQRCTSVRQGAVVAAGCGAAAGALLSLLGGRLMLGSLDLLSRQLPGSRLSLDNISQLFGEASFGPITRTVTSALEGALFAGGVVGAMLTARREFTSAKGSGVDQ